MNAKVFIIGRHDVPAPLKKQPGLDCVIIENPYDLRDLLNQEGEKVIVNFLPFLEIRHFDIYSYLQKTYRNVKTFFVVEELSSSMRIRLKSSNDFVILWKTEEMHLARDIHSHLEGRKLEMRQDSRERHSQKALLSPSLLPQGLQQKTFQPILGGSFDNISMGGSCLKIKAPFYNKKDFVNLTYQNNKGDYVSIEGQVRWARWNEESQSQELGVQFLTQG